MDEARMANRYAGLLVSLLAAAMQAVGLAGCAARPSEADSGSAGASMLVDSLPPPNFDGPDLVDPPAAPPVVSIPLLPPGDFGAAVPRDWTPFAKANAWRWIVIHHSATPTGGAAAFDKMHKAKGWDELGYHFVVGNGTDTRDGQIEVGARWPRQKWGAHAKTPDNRYNDFGIGICLVGNFDLTRPTDAQVKSVSKLIAHLMRTYRIPAERVVGHSDTGRPTECPGRMMNVAQVRRMSVQILVDAGDAVVPDLGDTRTAAVELLTSTPQ